MLFEYFNYISRAEADYRLEDINSVADVYANYEDGLYFCAGVRAVRGEFRYQL